MVRGLEMFTYFNGMKRAYPSATFQQSVVVLVEPWFTQLELMMSEGKSTDEQG